VPSRRQLKVEFLLGICDDLSLHGEDLGMVRTVSLKPGNQFDEKSFNELAILPQGFKDVQVTAKVARVSGDRMTAKILVRVVGKPSDGRAR
jgi:hypothetical protein